MTEAAADAPVTRAFVLGGGGVLGAAEVGMLRALLERGLRPDLVVGTSVGAINGAVVADEPDAHGVDELERLWEALADGVVLGGSPLRQVGTLARTRTHAHDVAPLAALLRDRFGDRRIEDLTVRFECVAASIERAAEHWFDRGPVVDAVLASAAVPGMFPPHRIGDEHYLDGGLVHSIPLGRAVELGAREVYVCHVGRIERPLAPPTRPWEVAMVAFEVARRHRFSTDTAAVPPGVRVHVLPTGDEPPAYADRSVLRYRDGTRVTERIRRAHAATLAHLASLPPPDASRAADAAQAAGATDGADGADGMDGANAADGAPGVAVAGGVALDDGAGRERRPRLGGRTGEGGPGTSASGG